LIENRSKNRVDLIASPNPGAISELIDNESKNPNMSLILIQSSIRIQNLKIIGLKMAKIQGSDGQIDKRKIAILNIDSVLNWIILNLRDMEVLSFASPKWVFMLKSVEKWLCKTRKYKTMAGCAILHYSAICKFWKKVTSKIFLWIDVFKSKVSNDFDENQLNYGTFMSGHLEFLPHFELLSLKMHIFSFYGLDCQNMSLHQL
jgi:hypothetical protein